MVNNETPASSPGGEVVVYEASDGEVRVDVRLEQETVWLTQRQMAEVLQTSTDNVSLHLRNIYSDGELEEVATTEDFSAVRAEGKLELPRFGGHLQTVQRRCSQWQRLIHRMRRSSGARWSSWSARAVRQHSG